jgi:hypothetical protein
MSIEEEIEINEIDAIVTMIDRLSLTEKKELMKRLNMK